VRAIALIEALDHICARARLEAFAPALAERGCALEYSGIPRDAIGRLRLFSRLDAYDLVILQRRLLPKYQLHFLRRHAQRLMYDFDDAMFHRDSYHRKGIVSKKRARQFGNIVRAADIVFAGNDFLLQRALRCGADESAVHLIPFCIETDKYTPSAHPRRPTLDLVWIGSSSTLQGLERQRPLIERLGATLPELRLRLICDRLTEFAAPPTIKVHWNEETEAAEVAAGDIGICWMPDDDWSKGKCGTKVLQYGAAGLPTIANPVGVHKLLIEHGVTGFLVETVEEWIEAVERLADPEMRRRMGRAAREFVERHYSVNALSERFCDLIVGRRSSMPQKGSGSNAA
jgi:glycosyltransferase involved in cell wall biosynthesis